jgi:hypothetical protein
MMTVEIHGKEYKTVAERVQAFRANSATANWTIKTELLQMTDPVIMKATIMNEQAEIIGTGHAEEFRGSTNINRTSALENCETSAIGRALASCGLAGTEYASQEEIARAMILQNENKQVLDSLAILDDSLGIALLSKTIEDQEIIDIFNSYPAGLKSNIKQAFRHHTTVGNEMLEQITAGLDLNDPALVLENIDGVSRTTKYYLKDYLGEEKTALLGEMTKKAAV